MPTSKTIEELTTDIVVAFLSLNQIEITELPELIKLTHKAMSDAMDRDAINAYTSRPLKTLQPDEIIPPRQTAWRTGQRPAVAIEKSVTPDYIFCLEDGHKYKMLKPALRKHYNMSPTDYRRKWGLPADYPMVAPNYAARRREIAKDIQLGKEITRTR